MKQGFKSTSSEAKQAGKKEQDNRIISHYYRENIIEKK